MRLRSFEAADLWRLDLQESQAHMRERFTDEIAEALVGSGAMTAVDDSGCPVACAGIVATEDWPHYAWALLSGSVKAGMVRITRACWANVSRETEPVFTHVRADLPANVRWLRALGFATTTHSHVLPDGHSYELWVRA